MSEVHPYFILLFSDNYLFLLLVLIQLHLLEDVYSVFLLFRSEKNPACNNAVEKIFQMLFRFGCLFKKILLKLLVVLIDVFLVNFHGGKG